MPLFSDTLACVFLKNFTWVTLVNKFIQVSGIQFYNTSSVYCVVCSPPKVKSPSITIYPPLPSSTAPTPSPSGNHRTVVCIYGFVFL